MSVIRPGNLSSAVRQQRKEPHNSLDDFPTPPWATRALCEWLEESEPLRAQICREPAANRGHMVRPLAEFFRQIEASDIHDYGAGFDVEDYIFGPDQDPVDWTITNPPFRLAEQFIDRALRTSRRGVAVIVRSAFLEGMGRWQRLFAPNPPTDILQFTERCAMFRGRLGGPKETSATAYCWVVWRMMDPVDAPRFRWLPPSRNRLTRDIDFLAAPAPRNGADTDHLRTGDLPNVRA